MNWFQGNSACIDRRQSTQLCPYGISIIAYRPTLGPIISHTTFNTTLTLAYCPVSLSVEPIWEYLQVAALIPPPYRRNSSVNPRSQMLLRARAWKLTSCNMLVELMYRTNVSCIGQLWVPQAVTLFINYIYSIVQDHIRWGKRWRSVWEHVAETDGANYCDLLTELRRNAPAAVVGLPST